VSDAPTGGPPADDDAVAGTVPHKTGPAGTGEETAAGGDPNAVPPGDTKGATSGD
jgi:hypothetical protein